MTHTKDEALKLAAEFDKRFTSMNGVDVPERVSVPRDEWRALHTAIKQALAAPVQEPVAHCEAGPDFCQQCHYEDQFENRSLALAAAVRYVKNNAPKLVFDEIYMALNTPPAQPAPILTTAEQNFLECVFRNPGCKIKGEQAYDENEQPLWPRLTELGLIEAVGSYKWNCTPLVKLCITEKGQP